MLFQAWITNILPVCTSDFLVPLLVIKLMQLCNGTAVVCVHLTRGGHMFQLFKASFKNSQRGGGTGGCNLTWEEDAVRFQYKETQPFPT